MPNFPPRVHVRADDGARRIAIVSPRVGEQAVPHDGGAIVGVAEAQLDAGGAFQRRAGLPVAVVHGREQRDPAFPVGLLAQHLQEREILIPPGGVADAADAAFQLVEDQDHVPVAEIRAQHVQVRRPFPGPAGAEVFRDQQPQRIVRERPVGQLPDHRQRVVGRRPVVAEGLYPCPGGPGAREQVISQQQGVGLAESLGGVGEDGADLRATVEPITQPLDEGVDVRRGAGELQEAGGVSFQAGGRAGTEAFEVDDPIQLLRRGVTFGEHGI